MEGYGNENPGAFQPTRPLRGATTATPRTSNGILNFNPRAPCGARPATAVGVCMAAYFNPRAPCGARLTFFLMRRPQNLFQPTRPLRGATHALRDAIAAVDISTHAPLAGRDCDCGKETNVSGRFQPTRPLRGATV